MNPLPWVKIFQNHIKSHEITSNYIKGFTCGSKKVKPAKTRQKIELLSEKWAKIPNASHLKSLCIMPLWSQFWRPFQCPNWVQDSSLEISAYLLSNPSGISEFGFHFPSKNEFSQHYFLCVLKGAERSILGCFWPFWRLKTYQNLWVMGRHA